MCGATTTFAMMADGHLLGGLLNQPFAALLFLITALIFGVASAEFLLPAGRWRRLATRLAPRESALATIFLALMGLGWIYKIVLMR